MNKLLLVSSGLGALLDFVERDPKTLKLIFILTAGKTSKNPWWIEKDRKTLKEMGFKFSELDIEGIDYHQLSEALTGVDVVFVAGGNTFYLLDMMQRCGFGQCMSNLLDKEGVQYVGSSAGSIVVGPNIEAIDSLDDPKDAPGLKTTKGLDLVDFVIIPHVNMSERQDYIKKIDQDFGNKYELILINDEQAVAVDQSGNHRLVASKQV